MVKTSVLIISLLLIIIIVAIFVVTLGSNSLQRSESSSDSTGNIIQPPSRQPSQIPPQPPNFPPQPPGLPSDNPSDSDKEFTLCSPESKKAEACIEIYSPVCGLFDPKKIVCIKAPCGKTYSNSCHACSDENVLSYSEGECQV